MFHDLFRYIKNGHNQRVYALINQFPFLLEVKHEDKMTPLMDAAYKGNVELIEFFIKEGVDVNDIGFEGYTALMMACLGGHEEATLTLLEHGANKDIKNRIGKTWDF